MEVVHNDNGCENRNAQSGKKHDTVGIGKTMWIAPANNRQL